jgi:hypothetical protein
MIAETSMLAHPLLRTLAVGVHGFAALWFVGNGVAHQIHVLIKARADTLKPGADVSSLLAVGAGLIIAGGVASYGLGPLTRATAPSIVPALLGVGVAAAVIAAIAAKYGFMFLSGSILISTLDLALLLAHATANRA